MVNLTLHLVSFFGINSNKGPARDRDEGTPPKAASFQRLSDASIDTINEDWENNEKTSMMWEIIKDADIEEFAAVLQQHPELAHIRSEDGRGPMWWAHEYGRPKMISVLRQLGVREDRTDSQGVKPSDITNDQIKGSI